MAEERCAVIWYIGPMVGDNDELGSDEEAEAFRVELEKRYGSASLAAHMGFAEITLGFPTREAAAAAEQEVLRLALERNLAGCGIRAEVRPKRFL